MEKTLFMYIERVKDHKLLNSHKIYCSDQSLQTEKNEEKLLIELEMRDRLLAEKIKH